MNLIGITYTQSPPDPLSISAIIIAITTAIWSVIFYIIQKKIDKKYEEQIENLKAKNESCIYITKVQFDYKFKIYQELSETSFNSLRDLNILYSNRNNLQSLINAEKSLSRFQQKTFRYEPFMDQNIHKIFFDLSKNIGSIITGLKSSEGIDNDKFEELKSTNKKLHTDAISSIRENLDKLRIIES